MATDLFGPLLEDALTAASRACTSAKRQIIAVGEVAFDDCCDGQVWARLISAVPAPQTNQTPAAAQACGVVMWDATVGIGMVRCAATVNDQGAAPAPSVLCYEALTATADMAALQAAISCDLAPTRGARRVRFLRWDAIGPEGGCVGGEWQISVLVDVCGC